MGIYSRTAVGYCSGFTSNPAYEEACSGLTRHTEGVRVVDILCWFVWEAHDPTLGMGQIVEPNTDRDIISFIMNKSN